MHPKRIELTISSLHLELTLLIPPFNNVGNVFLDTLADLYRVYYMDFDLSYGLYYFGHRLFLLRQ